MSFRSDRPRLFREKKNRPNRQNAWGSHISIGGIGEVEIRTSAEFDVSPCGVIRFRSPFEVGIHNHLQKIVGRGVWKRNFAENTSDRRCRCVGLRVLIRPDQFPAALASAGESRIEYHPSTPLYKVLVEARSSPPPMGINGIVHCVLLSFYSPTKKSPIILIASIVPRVDDNSAMVSMLPLIFVDPLDTL